MEMNSDFISLDANDDECKKFKENGFVFIKDVLSAENVKILHDRVSPLFHGKFETGVFPDEWHWRKGLSRDDITREMVNAWKCDTEFAKVALSEQIGSVVAKLMGWTGARLAQDDIFWKPVAGKPIGFHQDQPYMDFFMPNEVATVWIALTDVSKQNGTLEYVRGSHKWPTSDAKIENIEFHAPEDYTFQMRETAKSVGISQYETVSLEFSAGTCSVHHGRLWHGSATNPSTVTGRVSLALHFIPAEAQFNPDRQPGYIYGRYKLFGSDRLEESFFPITYTRDGYKSECIKSYTTATIPHKMT